MKSVDVCIVLPAKDEAITIQEAILRFHNELPEAYVLVVNNNSSDDTAKTAKKTLAVNNIQGVVLDEVKLGKANAVKRAFEFIDANTFVICDADLTYPVDCVKELLKPVLTNQADLVIGDRIAGGCYQQATQRRFHFFGNVFLSALVRIFYGQRIGDVSSGFRVMSRCFVKNYDIRVGGFELEADMLVYAIGAKSRIKCLPIEYYARPTGSSSKLNTLSDGLRHVKVIVLNSTRFPWFVFVVGTLFFMFFMLLKQDAFGRFILRVSLYLFPNALVECLVSLQIHCLMLIQSPELSLNFLRMGNKLFGLALCGSSSSHSVFPA